MATPTAEPKKYGVTAPLATELPTESQLKMNESLLAELQAQNNFASTEDTEQRQKVLAHFEKVSQELIKQVGKIKKLSQAVIDQAGCKVFTFGSYRLGVYGPGSDIDTLLVGPKHVTREDFFKYFPPLLEKMSPAGAIEEITPVADAHVPIIKLEFSGVSVDLIFASLMTTTIDPKLELMEDKWLAGLQDVDQRSLNGTRVTDTILNVVPEKKSFRHALRAIKLWAQRRAIYANAMGFPGGVAWAMMVARVCQLFPRAPGAVIVDKFFTIMSVWKWPNPVLLKNLEQKDGVRSWNPKLYPGDRRHIMPIITPASPEMCATHNITTSTRDIVIGEMKRASVITGEIFAGKKTWKDLFIKHTFFTQDYKHYLSINTASLTKEGQQIWSGLVSSKVRKLVSRLDELSSQIGVARAHPFNKGFERVHRCKPEDIKAVVMGDMQYQVKEIPTETDENSIKQSLTALGNAEDLKMPSTEGVKPDNDGLVEIFTTTYYIGLEVPQREGDKQLNISSPVDSFTQECCAWPSYVEDSMFLKVVYTRNFKLPEDVFEAGEQRPVKKSSGKKNKATALAGAENGVKRKPDTTNINNESAAKRQKSTAVA